MDRALLCMEKSQSVRALLSAMLTHVLPLDEGVKAMQLAGAKGVLKVQLCMDQ